jgi:hypothetical protein
MPLLQPVPSGAITAASIVVTSDTAGSCGQGFAGLAYEKQMLCGPTFSASNTSLVKLFKLLGPSVLCIGGASVDQTVWTSAGNGQSAGEIAPSDVDALASFLRATGWSCIYGINLGGSATGATTPEMAAAEAAYVSRSLGPLLAGIEIGNACESYGAPGSYYPGSWTVEIFETLWKTYRDAILAAAPQAPIVGPAASADVDSWTIPFGEFVTSSAIAALTQQYSRPSATASTAAALIQTDPALSSDLLDLRYGAQSIDVPFRITSCTAGEISGVSNAYASSLWAIDTIFTSALGGAEGINLACGEAHIGSPIASTGGVVDGVQPAFYGMLLAAMAGGGDLLSTQVNSGALDISAYTVRNSDGNTSVIIVNKDSTQNLKMNMTLPDTVSAATLQCLTQSSGGAIAPDLTALSGVTVQGASAASDGSISPGQAYALQPDGSVVTCYVPALSAVLIRLN